MTEERDDKIPTGAPLEEENSTTQDLRAALSRARVDDLATGDASPSDSLPSASDTAAATPEAAAAAVPASEQSSQSSDAFAAALGGGLAQSQSPAETPAPSATADAQAGMIQVPADHPMAQFYANTPEPPTFKSNRLAGILISLLAGLAFGVLLAGIISALLAPMLAPSQFSIAIVEYLLSLAFWIPVAVFTVALIILVLIVNRAGWSAYVLGGFVIGVAVWLSAVAGWVLSPDLSEMSRQEGLLNLTTIMLLPLPILAGVAAREVTVWFGAWIGARGRRIRAHNAEALEAYEASLAELQAENSAKVSSQATPTAVAPSAEVPNAGAPQPPSAAQ
jgi:hypothetical protein